MMETNYLHYLLEFFSNIIGAIMAFYVLQKIADWSKWYDKKSFTNLSKCMMPIYLFHQQIIYFVISALNGKVHPVLNAFANFTISLFVSWLISWLLLKCKITKFLIGQKWFIGNDDFYMWDIRKQRNGDVKEQRVFLLKLLNILVRWIRTSGNLEIRCPEVEIIYASLISHWFIQAINLTHGSVMLIINACDVDLITIMCNTINDCIGKRTCFASKSSTSNNYGKAKLALQTLICAPETSIICWRFGLVE